jgi:hypothetical protein
MDSWNAVVKEVLDGEEITCTLQMSANQDDSVFKEWLGNHEQFHNVEIAFVKNRLINWIGKLFKKEWSVENFTLYECSVKDVRERVGMDGEVSIDMTIEQSFGDEVV